MDLLEQLGNVIGPANVLTGDDRGPWLSDWTMAYPSDPIAVLRPATTAEVSAILRIANDTGTPVVPAAGRTGLVGGLKADGALVLSVDRMNKIREIRPDGRIAIVEAGVILSSLHDAAEAEGLIFPLTFGARGSAMIGGVLGTNAGGSNVLRYGNTRDLCLGLEVVLADGRVMNLMSELHKDNSGFNLRHLMIGSEGTLGVITAAVLKLRPKPRAYATAMVALPSLADALGLLNRVQDETGGAVEAFEYMPRGYIDRHLEVIEGVKPPFEQRHDVNILIEVGATAPRDATAGDDGQIPVVAHLETVLAEMMEDGTLLDAIIAQNEAQRREMWARREAAAEIAHGWMPFVDTDIALPLDKVAVFFDMVRPRIEAIKPGCADLAVAHLGDGNIHYSMYPGDDDKGLQDRLMEAVEDVVETLGGSFSAEHGIGLSKLSSMRRRKDPLALDVMRAIKAALDPKGILNPGKVLPE
ncbi:FAD-binding oxidoreductase [Loktanella sp. IMCC34160]|uniref:FAD-binding oxidoreductase n=1 Tax=Loktanella sp. IMCC34160 TaxID=2510646 RepID=UPI00101BD817|nr:FAD-binding oxidoreductase [Loktanella sp. IMCC34160]RYG91546.1 FAD-binding oxidoreductase [Loktanella sp. IMCC34160]